MHIVRMYKNWGKKKVGGGSDFSSSGGGGGEKRAKQEEKKEGQKKNRIEWLLLNYVCVCVLVYIMYDGGSKCCPWAQSLFFFTQKKLYCTCVFHLYPFNDYYW